ncbi:EI24 domain-containing protein [Alcaligenaceae bacterium]|nr:EI24 domain-containing protein [Alcaligenaceae bacterium]
MNDTTPAVQPSLPATIPVEPSPIGVGLVGLAFKRALVSQLHPKMLATLFLPFLIAALGAVLLMWFLWTPLTNFMNAHASEWGMVNTVDQWMVGIGLFSLKVYLTPILAAGLLLPIAGLLGIVIAAVFVMPVVLGHIQKRDYPDLERMGQHATAVGAWNALWVGVVFVSGWLITMPLWLIPPLAILLPLFWWAYAFNRMLRVDALVEHATGPERRLLYRRHNGKYWLIGLMMAILNFFPPAWLILPVYSALVFGHFSLEALRQQRKA